jgi:dihydrofolate reductase
MGRTPAPHSAGRCTVGCSLAQTLIQNDMIDEYRMLTFPVVIRSGTSVFGAGIAPATLSLESP